MPFKIRLKKSRQYNVSSKSLFVISVVLLDNTIVECTLSADSTGNECLANVSQRLAICQSEFFGLRFTWKNHSGRSRWVQLDRPLKRQLDKYAAPDTPLHLGVMFYVLDVNFLQDEMTRYQYFLQLKTDIIEGRLLCNREQAVLLASYSVQAEFGDHEIERHTIEYLKGFVLLPKYMTVDESVLEAMIEEMITAHQALQGLSPALAEVYYIMEAQHLEGYGQEIFPAKDESGMDILAATSLTGIRVKNITGQHNEFYKWHDITNLKHSKKYIGIEIAQSSKHKGVTVQLDDADMAKYLWRMCIQQHKFYLANKGALSSENSDSQVTVDRGKLAIPDIQASLSQMNLAKPTMPQHSPPKEQNPKFYPPQLSNSVAHLPVHLPCYMNEPDSGATYQHSQTQNTIAPPLMFASHSDVSNGNNLGQPFVKAESDYQNLDELSQHYALITGSIPQHPIDSFSSNLNLYQQPSDVYGSIYSLPHPSEGQRNVESVTNTGLFASHDNRSNLGPCRSTGAAVGNRHNSAQELRALLPSYRPAPDYNTALQQKYDQLTVQISYPSTAVDPFTGNFSQPYSTSLDNLNRQPFFITTNTIPTFTTESLAVASSPQRQMAVKTTSPMNYSHYKNYDDLANVEPKESLPYRPVDKGLTIPVTSTSSSSSHTYSTPELAINTNQEQQLLNDIRLLYQFRPPPPYPLFRRSSSSTPELAGSEPNIKMVSMNPTASHRHSSEQIRDEGSVFEGSSPELVSRKPMSVALRCSSTDVAVGGQSLPNGSSQSGLHTTVLTISNHQPPVQLQDQIPIQSVPRLRYVNENVMSDHTNTLAYGAMKMAAMNGLTAQPWPDLLGSNIGIHSGLGSKDNMRLELEKRLAEGIVFGEFEQIPRKRVSDTNCSVGSQAESIPRNRFKDVLPYDDNRVKLTPTKDNRLGYINASHITVTVGATQRLYIASQGPLSNTVAAFWQMVWEHNIYVICMLTDLEELGRPKCFPYWPADDNKLVEYGEYQLMRKFSNPSTSFITSSLQITHTASKKQRNIWHIQYTDWPDHGVPEDVHGFISFMEEIDTVRRHANGEMSAVQRTKKAVPVLVHCSAGVGRSGVCMLVDIMIYCLDYNEPVDIPNVLSLIRHQRMMSVQTLAQYKFVYTVLIQYLKNSRLI